MGMVLHAYEEYAAVTKCSGDDRVIVIPDMYEGKPVTEIERRAFANMDKLEEVTIPSCVKRIEAMAFAGCGKLRRVGVKTGPTMDWQKTDAEAVETSILPNVRFVGQSAFSNTAIQNVVFGAIILEIGSLAFEGCKSLETVTFEHPGRVRFGMAVFSMSCVKKVKGEYKRVFAFGEKMFAFCSELKSVEFRSVEEVGMSCFAYCLKLENLSIGNPASVGDNAFRRCDKLGGDPFKRTVPLPRVPEGVIAFDPDKSIREQIAPLGITPEDEKRKDPATAPFGFFDESDEDDDEDDEDEEPMLSWDGTMAEEPLFRMEVQDGIVSMGGIRPGKLPEMIVGKWVKDPDGYRFRIDSPLSAAHQTMRVVMDDAFRRYQPLVEFAQKQKRSDTTLLGVADANGYVVHELIPAMGQSWDAEQSRRFFNGLVQRLRKASLDEITMQELPDPYIHRNDELDAYFDVCHSTMPRWVVEAYRKNKLMTLCRTGDERRHAKLAMELLVNIEWQTKLGRAPELDAARKVLDEAFHGLNEVKDRILEVLAQIRRAGTLPKWGILLHGPAGTGKTTIAKAVAMLLDMPLIQMDMSSLGRESETISGTSRIYNNASPGLLLARMYENRSSTAVLVANEVDKIPEKGRSACDTLLTILDKTGFYENFLEEIIPTDNIFCVGTCNDIEKISQPLRDRFLIIDVPPYTREEKQVIWNDFVLPKARRGAQIDAEQLTLTPEATRLLVEGYATLPGVRDLEQNAERIVGDYCRCAEQEPDPEQFTRVYDVEDMKRLFGPARAMIRHFAMMPGQVNAAFYHDGVAYFFLVEASVCHGTGKFEVIGAMSNLQKDYAKVAYRCVQNTTSFDLSQYDVSIFIPHEIPDGVRNHVGLACYAAICSKLLGTNLAVSETCFVGGCDMNGSLYFDEHDLEPLLRAMRDRGVTTLYAPLGTNRLLEGIEKQGETVAIIEAPDAETLFSIAAAQGGRRR